MSSDSSSHCTRDLTRSDIMISHSPSVVVSSSSVRVGSSALPSTVAGAARRWAPPRPPDRLLCGHRDRLELGGVPSSLIPRVQTLQELSGADSRSTSLTSILEGARGNLSRSSEHNLPASLEPLHQTSCEKRGLDSEPNMPSLRSGSFRWSWMLNGLLMEAVKVDLWGLESD